ncbi:hypothetical protein VTN02DRAFT_1657 [Thermoascus thermophilus]
MGLWGAGRGPEKARPGALSLAVRSGFGSRGRRGCPRPPPLRIGAWQDGVATDAACGAVYTADAVTVAPAHHVPACRANVRRHAPAAAPCLKGRAILV